MSDITSAAAPVFGAIGGLILDAAVVNQEALAAGVAVAVGLVLDGFSKGGVTPSPWMRQAIVAVSRWAVKAVLGIAAKKRGK